MKYCHICYSLKVDDEFICDKCDNYYCEGCSYAYTIHFQYEGGLCYYCSDQKRKKPLSKEDIRDNKMIILFHS